MPELGISQCPAATRGGRVNVRGKFRIRVRFDETTIRRVFVVSLWLKGGFALTEILGGVAAYLLTQKFLVGLANTITEGELREDPHDLVANYLLHGAQTFSVSAQHFAAVYLFGHGLIKLWLIVGLLRRRLWYYPTAMIVFGLFIVYQLYRFYFTHSVLLVLVTIVDVIVMVLTWHEYRYLEGSSRP
ncbi:MAG: DUF2127 domain-containing protein, partial [Alphaproteobacteria bacterium]|nr:DUF2127 domain-containing protein [Alphaproteobacteria bacterium]